MNDFLFDLQRFTRYETKGSIYTNNTDDDHPSSQILNSQSVQIVDGDYQVYQIFSVIDNTTDPDNPITLGTYQMIISYYPETTAEISTDESGNLSLKVSSGGYIINFTDTSTNKTVNNVTLLGGSFRSIYVSGDEKINVILGKDGPTLGLSCYKEDNVGNSQFDVDLTDDKVTLTITPLSSETQIIDIGNITYTTARTTSGNLELSLSSDGKISLDIESSSSDKIQYTYTDSDENEITETCEAINGTIKLASDADGNVYFSSLDVADSFKITGEDGTEITYTMYSNKKLVADKNGTKRVWTGDPIESSEFISRKDLDYEDPTSFIGDYIMIEGKDLDFSSDSVSNALTNMVKDEPRILVNDDNFDIAYGTIKKIDDNHFLLEYNSATEKLDSIKITNGYTVGIDKNFVNVPITFSDDTQFITKDSLTADYFSVMPASVGSDIPSVYGSEFVNLVKGTLITADSLQAIATGNYTISGYKDTTAAVVNPDGITFSADNIVGDVDQGESFSITSSKETVEYSLVKAGLLTKKIITTTEQPEYRLHVEHKPSGTSTGIAINLNTINHDDGDVITAPDNGLLEIGTYNSVNAIVFNSSESMDEGYASIGTSDNDQFTLAPYEGSDSFQEGISTISLTGGDTTIYQSLIGSTGNVTITTYGSASERKGATFLVTASNGDTFTVSGKKDYPTVTNATAITLLSGSLTATASSVAQEITLGTSGQKVTFTAGSTDMHIELNSDETTFTVTAIENSGSLTGGKFTFNNQSYEVVGGNGMTFTLDPTGDTSVTIGGLSANDNDVFSYANTTYSVKGAGFIKESSGKYSLLAGTGNTVAVNDLTTAANWKALTTVNTADNVNKVTIIANPDPTTSTLIDNGFSTTYGGLEKNGAVFNLTRTDSDKGTLSAIVLESGVNNVSLQGISSSNNFLGVSIEGANSTTFKVDEAGNNYTYQVSLSSGGSTSLDGATKATLYKGSLTADSNISSGVVVNGDTVIAGEKVTLITDSNGSNASIAGVSKNEHFSLTGHSNYTLGGAGLVNSNNQILRGTKPDEFDDSTLKISDITNTANWLGMIAADSTLTIGRGNSTLLVVDNTSSPASLFGELTPVDNNSYSLTGGGDYDEWNKDYKININNSTVTLSSNFSVSSFQGSLSGAEFSIGSLKSGATSFVVADRNSGGASLSNISAITQTGGFIAQSGINSITVGDKTIYNSSGLDIDVSIIGGGDASLRALDSLDNFNIAYDGGSINYSINNLGIMTGNELLKSSSVDSSSAKLSDLTATHGDNWIYVATINDNIFYVPPTQEDDEKEWLILDSAKEKAYATLTKEDDNNYSISKNQSDWETWSATLQVGDGKTLGLSSDFAGKNISVESSGAVFTIKESVAYTVIDNTDTKAASVGGGAKTITQTAGTIALANAAQSIIAGGHSISGTSDNINVIVSDGNASLGDLDANEIFIVDGTNYTLLSNGRIQRTDNAIWNGGSIASANGSVAIESLKAPVNWFGAIMTDNNGNLTVNSSVASVFNASIASAFIVNPSNSESIYGTMTKGTDNKYTLSGNDSVAPIRSVIVTSDIPEVTFAKEFVNVSLEAGDNKFTATESDNEFTVNYNGSNLRVDDAKAVSLQSGVIILSNDNSDQTIMANDQSVMGASESVNVNYDGSTVIIDSIRTANESLTINNDDYTLIKGDFDVSISSNGTTTVGKITKNDEFKINDDTFTYAEAGLTKTDSTGKSYLLVAIHPEDNKLTLNELTGQAAWLGTASVDNDNIVINSSLTSAILVDDVEEPTKTYGQIIGAEGNYTLTKDTSSSDFTSPTLITVQEGVTASIGSMFNNISVTSDKAASIIVTDSSNERHTISGTIDRFISSDMIFTPSDTNGDIFAVDGTSYEMEGAGLTIPDEYKIWTEAGITSYSLPADDSSWSNMITLTEDKILEFSEDMDEENSVIVDNDVKERYATLTYTASSSTYSLKAFNGNIIPSIQTADGTATFATDFDTTFETGNGNYKINNQTYRGNGLIITAKKNHTSTLEDGRVVISPNESVKPTNSLAISVTGGDSINAMAEDGVWQHLGALNNGDTFVIDGTTYKVYGSNTLAKLNSSGEPNQIYIDSITSGSLSYSSIISDSNYSDMVQLNDEDQLDLTTRLDITEAIVVEKDNPTNRIGLLEYNVGDNAYTLSTLSGGHIDDMTAVSLSTAVNTFNTDQEITVKTSKPASGNSRFTINGKSFVAKDDLTIATEKDNAILTGGSVALSQNTSVNTRYSNDNIDETITSTKGTITVTVSENAVTISDIASSNVFTVTDDEDKTTTYRMTAIGLVNDNSQLNVMEGSSITTAELIDGDWKSIVAAPSGALTIDSKVSDNAFVVDNTSNPTVKYGEITNSKGTYTLTQESSDPEFKSITVDGVKVVLPTTCKDISITIANGPTFKVTEASKAFTIDATSSPVGISSDVTAVELEEGELQTAEGLSVTASNNTIEATSGIITVGIDTEKGVYVGALNEYDEFTVNGTSYIMTGLGLLKINTGGNNEIASSVEDTYYLTDKFARIIAADGSTLDITNETTNGDVGVYDSKSNPTIHMADLKIQSDGKILTLNEQDGGISTITLGKDKTLTVDFAATVNASGTTTVNSNAYVGTTALTIDASSGNSTLQQGTITLTSGKSAKATNDETSLTVNSGSINATAADGKFTNLSALNAGDIFAFDKTYTQSNIGLLSNDGLINTGVTTSVTVANLSGSAWQKILEATDGALSIATDTESG
ncbi:MAG: hypothetical protein IJQ82_12895, partial [Selenomonadaceae bacterium]|nr:hypothetical protein [Selenomonadaceae bacterium]